MKYLYSALIVFLTMPDVISGQTEKEPDKPAGELFLNIKSMNFFRNNEYFNPIGASPFKLTGELPLPADKSLWIEGYTLPGFFFRPELVYNPTDKISLRAGTHILKYWGKDNFAGIRPLLSASLNLSHNTVLTIGSLSGSDKHRMYDPHFDSERLYWGYAEDGLQIRTINEHIFNDAWINWENFILKGDKEREIFTFGESFRYYSPKILELVNIELPVQLQFKHYGGQISDYPEHVTTFFNIAGGLRVNFEGSFGKVGLEYTAFLNSVIPSRETYTISEGNASWYRIHYTLKRFYFGASYWNANDFYAPNGNGIFASIYVFDSDYVINQRKLITGSAYINLLPEEYLELFFGADTYFDVCESRLDYALTLHLNFGDMFRIIK